MAPSGFARFWAKKSRPRGRPPLADELVVLIRRMAGENRTWSRRRIASELAKLGHKMDILALSLLAVVPTVAAVAPAAYAQNREHRPKVSIDDARAKALSLVPGKVKAEELEREGGRWIYSFEIKPTGETRRIIKEVNIDADTGVLAGKIETERE